MIKNYLLLVAVLCSASLLFAQQDPNFTVGQYHNLSYQNPAVLGSHDAYCVSMIGRLQWAGFEGAPSTFLFSAEAPLNFFGNHGLGLTIMSDALGNENTMVAKFGYNYKFTNLFAGGDLRVGIGIGYISKTLGSDWKAIDGSVFDPNIPVNGASEGGVDLDFGVFYKIPGKLSVGISSTHLTASQFNSQLAEQIGGGNTGQYRQFKYQIDRTIYVSAQYETEVINSDWVLKPGLFVKSDLTATSFNLGALMEYQQKFWGGLDYRVQDAVALMLGANFQMNGTNVTGGVLKVGYSYDFTTSAISSHSSGSHEIFARYCFNLNSEPPKTSHGTVRFL